MSMSPILQYDQEFLSMEYIFDSRKYSFHSMSNELSNWKKFISMLILNFIILKLFFIWVFLCFILCLVKLKNPKLGFHLKSHQLKHYWIPINWPRVFYRRDMKCSANFNVNILSCKIFKSFVNVFRMPNYQSTLYQTYVVTL